jgi:hypothetical protein
MALITAFDFHISMTFANKTKKPGIAAWLFLGV